ncbi:MAG: hypothetical protein EPO22_09520 [Dehalococcoidia bacterium]|nr:MAG: hypothetical protein EPO22_09520 [Dehalococcoidia bacterium]
MERIINRPGWAAAAALAIAVLGSVIASPAAAEAHGPRDSAAGELFVRQAGEGYQRVKFSAQSGTAGENPHGRVQVTVVASNTVIHAKGTVTCLYVNGTSANIAALLDEPYLGILPYVTLSVHDNGRPVHGVSPDTAYINFDAVQAPQCATGGFTLTGESRGDIKVYDTVSP